MAKTVSEPAVRAIGKKMPRLADIENIVGTSDIEELSDAVRPLVERGVLVPVKNARRLGGRGSILYERYRLQPADNEVLDAALEQTEALHPLILANGWLARHPEAFVRHGERLRRLSDWLWRTDGRRAGVIARNERAFEIWREEKAFDDPGLRRVLEACGVGAGALGYYEVRDLAFLDYVPQRKSEAVVVLSENKTPWHSMRRLMFELGQEVFFGERVDGVVFSAGNKVTYPGTLEAFADYASLARPRFRYWGDVDREGIDILFRLAKATKSDVEPFYGAYQAMWRTARRLRLRAGDFEKTDDGRRHDVRLCDVLPKLGSQELEFFSSVLAENRRMPQEMVNFEVMREVVEK